MREYGKLKTAFWRNRKIRGLSERARILAAYVISCPHGNSAGCFVLPYGYVAEDLGWNNETVRKLFDELIGICFVERDDETNLTRVVPWWEHNTVENPNVGKNVIREIKALPNCSVKQHAIESARGAIDSFETVLKLFDQYFRNPDQTRPEPDQSQTSPKEVVVVASDALPLFDEMVDAYNVLAGEVGLPKVERLTAGRRSHAALRLRECGGLDGWGRALAKVRDSPFLRGDNDRGWRADFDFLMKPGKLLKVLEGTYDGSRVNGHGQRTGPATGIAQGFADALAERSG